MRKPPSEEAVLASYAAAKTGIFNRMQRLQRLGVDGQRLGALSLAGVGGDLRRAEHHEGFAQPLRAVAEGGEDLP